MKFRKSHVHKAIICLFTAIFLSTHPLRSLASEDAPPRLERYAALECQSQGFFAIVNFYPGGIFKLSWGENDTVVQADMPVERSVINGTESYKNSEVLLTLPISKGASSISARVGMLYTTYDKKLRYMKLRCLLHGAD